MGPGDSCALPGGTATTRAPANPDLLREVPMSTTRMRALAALLGALSVDACAARTAVSSPRPMLVAENGGREWLDVYLVHELGTWYLGRLAPGARGTLAIPARLPDGASPMVRLAVIAGAPRTMQPTRDPRAVVTLAQPVGAVLGQRWAFVQGQLTGLRSHPRTP